MQLMKIKLLVLALLPMAVAFGQTGGTHSFPFLELTYNARSAGLGGNFISVYDDDINLGVANPSLLNSQMNKDISFSSALQPGGINHGMLGYGFDLVKIQSTMSGYIKYISYGSFERTNEMGISEGTFTPFEMIAGAGIGKEINKRMRLGANLNFLYSQLETYNAFGASVDFAGTYFVEEKGFLLTMMARNIGYEFKGYFKGDRAPLPVQVQLAASYRVKHAPFRLTILAHHLQKWDITYNDPNLKPTVDAFTGDTIPVERAGFFEKLGRHFSYQLEVLAGKHVDFRVGFDYHRRKEMALAARPGLAGFSFGLGVHFSKFRLDYGFMAYSAAGYGNMLTLSTNLSKWRK
jgi:hypothetical protein